MDLKVVTRRGNQGNHGIKKYQGIQGDVRENSNLKTSGENKARQKKIISAYFLGFNTAIIYRYRRVGLPPDITLPGGG